MNDCLDKAAEINRFVGRADLTLRKIEIITLKFERCAEISFSLNFRNVSPKKKFVFRKKRNQDTLTWRWYGSGVNSNDHLLIERWFHCRVWNCERHSSVGQLRMAHPLVLHVPKREISARDREALVGSCKAQKCCARRERVRLPVARVRPANKPFHADAAQLRDCP